jgi:hypothetical protein
MTDINSDNPRCSALEEHLGKASCGSPKVEGCRALHVNVPVIKGSEELMSSPPHIILPTVKLHKRSLPHRVSVLGLDYAIDTHIT